MVKGIIIPDSMILQSGNHMDMLPMDMLPKHARINTFPRSGNTLDEFVESEIRGTQQSEITHTMTQIVF